MPSVHDPGPLEVTCLSLNELALDLYGPEAGTQISQQLITLVRALYHDFVIDWAEVTARTSLSKRTIQRLMQNGEFPLRIELSEFRSGWRNSDIDRWLRLRPKYPGY